MQASCFLAFLCFAATTLAITVTSPSQGATWSSSGPNTVTWTRVSTDPDNCAVTLVQQGVYRQTLAETVSTSRGSLTITGTLPVGNTYQVNLVRSSSPQDLNTILAQSAQFNITQGGTGSGAAGSASTSNGASTGSPTTVSVSATGTTDIPNASRTSNAASLEYHGGLLGVLVPMVAALI